MNKLLVFLLLILCTSTVLAQDSITEELKTLSEAGQFDAIVARAANSKDYPAKALFYIGMAYYMKEDDANCLKFMNRSVDKDAKDPAPHYIIASTLNYRGKYEEAIKRFNTAIALKADDDEFYSGLGDAYYNLQKKDLALEAYKKATGQPGCIDRPYTMIAQIYSDQKENDKALEAYHTAKGRIDKKSDSYKNALFNIGLLESLKGNHDGAEPAFLELLQMDSTDYHTCAKLIQVYYHRKEYDKAKPLKEKLYEAKAYGLVKGNLVDMFCYDQFLYKDYRVEAYERYEQENSNKIYDKHIFYVLDKSGKVVFRMQTEFSPISLELGGPKYMFCANKDGVHYNAGAGFNDGFQYEDLKAVAMQMMDKLLQ